MASNNKRKTSASQQRGTEKVREARRQAEAKKRKRNIIYSIIAALLIAAIIILWCSLPKATDVTSTSSNGTTTNSTADKNSIGIKDNFEEFEGKTVTLRLVGHCGSCPYAMMTLKQGIETAIKRVIPEVKSVERV